MESTLFLVIVVSLAGGIISLVGGLALLSDKKRAKKLAEYATPFAAGALLASAFIDLLPDAVEDNDARLVLQATLVGILFFFMMERFLHWFHHHHEHEKGSAQADPTISLIVIGDTLHNFIDGIAIAAAFLVSPSTGIVVTFAVAAHEIPQEIGDFGLLLHKGMQPKRVLLVNIISALATSIAAGTFFILGDSYVLPIGAILGVVAGFFIYIAVSDIIPMIHKKENNVIAGPQTMLLIVGVIFIAFVTSVLHPYIEADHDDHEDELHSLQIDRKS